MQILVISPSKIEREAMSRALARPPYRVTVASDLADAASQLAQWVPHVLVAAWPRTGGPEFIKQARSLRAAARLYVVAVIDERAALEIPALYAAGADDFMRRPFTQEELLGRIAAPSRIREWNGAPSGSSLDLTTLAAFPAMGDIVAKDLALQLGEPLRVSAGWPALTGKLRMATIPMSLASEGCEYRISVVAEPESLRALAKQLLGDAGLGEAELDDVLREMANAAGGAVKRACLDESVTLATGLPVTEQSFPAEGPSARRWLVATTSGKLRFGVIGEARRRPNQRVSAVKLVEGMVLARDLCTEMGALLVVAGTRLTSTNASRLAKILGDRVLVEVACAA